MIVWFSIIIAAIGWCVDCYIEDLCPNCNLYQDSAEVRSHCAYPCQCANRDPVCEPGVPHTRDGCGCCPVCARQDGDPCDGIAVCDQRKGLVCQYDDYYSPAGICRVTNNADESETQIHSINETTDSNDDIMTNNTSEIKQNEISLNEKRTDYLSWDDLFMAIASLTANFGTDVGACIVDMDKKIVGIGYNELIHDPGLDFDFLRMCECSAEMNAILNKNSINVQDCTIYVSRYPCNERTKVIIQSGIKEVVYLEPRPNLASKKMFDASGIKIRNHTPKQTRLHFKEPNEKKLSFDDLYMTIAYLIAQRSKDPVTQVGACIVDSDHKIVSTGYNGMPTGCNDDDFPWGKSDPSEFKKKFMYVCHAEMNAVFYKSSINVKGCTIYVSVFPCVKCAIIILKSGIKNVVYYWDPKSGKKKNIKIKSMFKSYGIITRYHQPIQNTRLEISTTA